MASIEVSQIVQPLEDGIARRFTVSQHALKSMEEILGDRKLPYEIWTGT